MLYALDWCIECTGVVCTGLMCCMYGLVLCMYWTGVLSRGIRILVEAMKQDHVVEAVGHEHINVP